MPRTAIFEWHGKEYSFGEKGADWYWALGIIATAGAIASILFNNILLALLIIAAAVTTGLVAAKRPRIHRFMIVDDGLMIDDHLYLFDSMIDFSVLEYLDTALPPALSIHTKSFLAPHLLIPIVDHDPEEIYLYISQHLDEGKHDESVFHRLVEMFRL